MNRIVVIAFAIAGIITRCFALTPASRCYEGQWKGQAYVVCANSDEHLGAVAVEWQPESGDPPLPLKRALALARESLKKMPGVDYTHFECEEIGLVAAAPGGPWAYLVKFYSHHESDLPKEKGAVSAILPFVIYLDGHVAMPQKKDA